MAINQEQIKEAKKRLAGVQTKASKIFEILVKADEVIYDDISLTPTQKTKLIAKYAAAKAELSDAVDNLL